MEHPLRQQEHSQALNHRDFNLGLLKISNCPRSLARKKSLGSCGSEDIVYVLMNSWLVEKETFFLLLFPFFFVCCCWILHNLVLNSLSLALTVSDSSSQPPRKRKAHFSDEMHDLLTPAYPISYRIPLRVRH